MSLWRDLSAVMIRERQKEAGLGLAIAKDLVKLMDGWFEIAIDGDLFKVRVVLDKAPAPVKQDE